MLVKLIQEMYDHTYGLVPAGSVGNLLSKPQLPYTQPKQHFDSYMLAKYIGPVTGKSFEKWVTKE
jgi:hypothetical protein